MNIQNIKNNSYVSNKPAISSNKVTIANIEESIKNYAAKSDSFSSVSNTTTNTYSTQDLTNLVGKVLYNEQFREVAINSNPMIKDAYDNFVASISKDDSELGEYIKSILSDSSKFSGEFFDVLNTLMLETNDKSVSSSIYNFLKVFDYFSTQTGNAYGMNSSLDGLLSSLPKDAQDTLLNLLATGSTNAMSQLDIFLSSIFDTKLPDSEKLGLAIDYLNNLVTGKNQSIEDDPLNIFIPNEPISNDVLNYVRTIAVKLDNLGLALPKEIGELIENLDIAKNIDTNQQANSTLVKALNNNIDELIKLANNVVNQKSNILSENINDLVKTLEVMKQSEIYKNSNNATSINNILNNLTSLNLQPTNGKTDYSFVKTLLGTLNLIKNEIISNDNINQNVQDNIMPNINNKLDNLLSDLLDSLMEGLIYSDSSKNKSELLLNLYEKEIIPVLLKNNDVVDKDAMSILTHNALRLKLGTASEFDNQIKHLFEQLIATKSIDTKQLLDMKLALAEKLASNGKVNNGLNAFVKLFEVGIKNAANDSIKNIFQDTMLSLISKDDVTSILKYYFIPFIFNGTDVLSEITIQKEKYKNNNGNNTVETDDETVYKITLSLDIKGKGTINGVLVYANGGISAKFTLPNEYNSYSESISNDISHIIENNDLVVRDVVIDK